MQADGSGQTNLTNHVGGDFSPAWSPDGSQIAFHSDRDGGNTEIYVMKADGTNQRNLSKNAAADTFPAWSPEGGRIAFVSDRDANPEIYVMDVGGFNQTRITTNAVGDFDPAWSPNGARIAFDAVSATGDRAHVYAMAANGADRQRLTKGSSFNENPDWQAKP